MDGFLAHEDIEASKKWMDVVFKELNDANIFIALLNENYLKSDYCSQELGIAVFKDKLIIPISLDGTKSYGFLEIIQSDTISLGEMQSIIVNNYPNEMINYLITSLRTCSTYKNCEKIMKLLEPQFEELSMRQVNRLLKISLNNDQIYGCWYCQGCLNKIYNLFREEGNPKLINELEKLLEELDKLDTTLYP